MNPNQISPTPPEEGQDARRIDGKSGLSLDLSPGQAEGWEALARHLSSPGKRETEDLPDKFGMAPELVTEVIKGLEHRSDRELPWVTGWRLVVSALKEIFDQLRGVFRKWTENPSLFLFAAFLLFFAIPHGFLLSQGFYSRSPTAIQDPQFPRTIQFAIYAVLGIICMAFVRWGSYRPLTLVAILAFLGFQPIVVYLTGVPGGVPAATWVIGCFISLVPVALLTGICALSAFVGSWVQLQKEDRHETRLSRQEMLDRLFTLESRLRAMPAEAFSGHRPSLRERTRRSALFPYYAVFIGLTFGLIEVFGILLLRRFFQDEQLIEFSRGLTRTVFGLAGLVLFGLIGFYTGGVWRSLVAGVIAVGGGLLAILTPIAPFGMEAFRQHAGSQSFALWAAGSIALAVFGGGAGVIDGRTARRRKARANDPAALLAEVILLRRRLQADQQTIVVMAVDVARSTMLKQDQDPLDVEFSFREYQKLVAEVAKQCGGEVFSEAGDGALASFRDASQALRAARLLQAHIQTFNAITNRLTGDFRLRIGMHAGEAQAGFADVPYHELIDIAAHVESAAPVGGIAVTNEVRKLLPDEEMAEVAAQVDGHPVWIILKPILFE